MRILKLGLTGGGIVAGVVMFSRFTHGFWPLLLITTAVFCGALTVGLMAATLVGSRRSHSSGSRDRFRRDMTAFGNARESESAALCGMCRRVMYQLGAIWVCRRCDMANSQS